MNELVVRDNPEELRYEALRDGQLVGIVRYRVEPGVVVLVHTEVDEAGRGVLVHRPVRLERGQPAAVLQRSLVAEARRIDGRGGGPTGEDEERDDREPASGHFSSRRTRW